MIVYCTKKDCLDYKAIPSISARVGKCGCRQGFIYIIETGDSISLIPGRTPAECSRYRTEAKSLDYTNHTV